MGAFGVVVGSPLLDDIAGMGQPAEQRLVQALVPEAPVQALDEARSASACRERCSATRRGSLRTSGAWRAM